MGGGFALRLCVSCVSAMEVLLEGNSEGWMVGIRGCWRVGCWECRLPTNERNPCDSFKLSQTAGAILNSSSSQCILFQLPSEQ